MSNIETKPQRNHLPHPLSLLLGPRLQHFDTRLTFGLFKASTGASQPVDTQRLAQIIERLSKLLRDIQRIRASTLMIKEVVLRGERHELREVAFTRSVGIMTERMRMVVSKGVAWTGNQGVGMRSERLNQRRDGMLRSFLAEG